MGQPIRWDNISGAGLSEAQRPLDSAAALFGNAFSGLRDTLKEREAIDTANWQNTKANNTTAYLDAIAKYNTPEALREAQKSGAIDALRQQFGYQIDADKVRGAADSRVASLQDQAQKEITYRHAQIDEATAKDVQDFQVARMNGDREAMARAMASYQAKNGRDPTALVKFADERDWLINERGMKMDEFQQHIATARDNIRHNKAMEGIQQTQANASVTQANAQAQSVQNQKTYQDWQINTANKAASQAEGAAKVAAYFKELGAKGNAYAKEGIYDGTQTDELRKAMKDFGIGDNTEDQSSIIEYVNKLTKDGIKITNKDGTRTETIHELPMSLVKAAIAGSHDSWWRVGWNTGYAKDVKAKITEALQEGFQEARDPAGNPYLRSKYAADLQEFKDALRDTTANPMPVRPALPQAQTPGRRK